MKYYISSNSDLKKEECCPLLHYVAVGKSEGRFAGEGMKWRGGLILIKDTLDDLIDKCGHEFGDYSYGQPRVIGG